ncbi:DUF6265 family protein [Vulgatibacter sp.]|uniref:DUF6265 family protein n=1 Tax=Vulgatibacter sp. TaxID=1971226 RepID=UPI003561A71E
MRSSRLLPLLLAAACTAEGAPAAAEKTASRPQPLAAPGSAALENLRFLTGTWRGERDGMFIEEVWTAPVGNSQLGVARVLEGPEPRDLEAAILHQSEDRLVLHLRHFGAVADRLEERGAKTAWRLVRHGPAEAIFEPMGEEKVRRITYRRDGEALTVTLDRAQAEPLVFRYQRVPSP